MKRALPCLAVVLAFACAGSARPRYLCQQDTDCNPGEACLQNECKGASAGPDAGTAPPDAGTPAGAIGPGGGTVDLLDFVMSGDTRPPVCDLLSLYPQDSFKGAVAQMARLSPQLALDLGDHMFACTQSLASARAQLKLYTDALASFPAPWFMTMGNHECESTDCSASPGDANFTAYAEALKRVSQQPLPYYKLDIQTRFGLLRIVFIADNYGDAAAQAWAESTLAEADRVAKYTLIAKHHPVTGTRTGPQWAHDVVLRHKYSLILTAHAHDYSHDTSAYGGRSVVCGLGGANTSYTGFCRVQQKADGALAFTAYDGYGNVRTDPSSTFTVAPQ